MYFRWHAAPQREGSELLVFCLRDRKSIKLITEWRGINKSNVIQISMPWPNQNNDQNHEGKTFFHLLACQLEVKSKKNCKFSLKRINFIELKQVKSGRMIHIINLIHLLKLAWEGQNREKTLWRNCWHPRIKRYWTQKAWLWNLWQRSIDSAFWAFL